MSTNGSLSSYGNPLMRSASPSGSTASAKSATEGVLLLKTLAWPVYFYCLVYTNSNTVLAFKQNMPMILDTKNMYN
jgi:hypothetical protein